MRNQDIQNVKMAVTIDTALTEIARCLSLQTEALKLLAQQNPAGAGFFGTAATRVTFDQIADAQEKTNAHIEKLTLQIDNTINELQNG